MSTTDAGAAAKGKWTEAENYSLVYQIVQQLNGEKPIKFDQINIPGRTARALSERWNKIKTDVDAAGISNSGPAGQKTVRAPRTPNKKKLADGDSAAEDGDGSPALKKPRTARKKKAAVITNDENVTLESGDVEA